MGFPVTTVGTVMATGRDRTRRTLAGAVALIGLLAAVVSCSDADDPDDAAGDTSTTPATSSPTPTEPSTATTDSATTDESTSIEPSGPTEASSSSQPPSGGLRSTLLPGSQLPPLNLENPWHTNLTKRTEPDPPAWVCQSVSLIGNGAVTSWVRTYTSAGTSTASQVVGQFADARSAKRAFGSLQGNARDCADELAERGRTPMGGPVQPLADLEVPRGQAGWGVVFSGPVRSDPDAAHIDAVVVVRVGERVSVVSMHSIGQDYNYPPGQTPPELAGPIVATRLIG